MGLFRLLFYVIAGYIAYILLRSLFRKSGSRRGGEHLRAGHGDQARLEEDPVCGVYISRETAIRRHVGDREVFFCSEQCAGRYLARSDKEN